MRSCFVGCSYPRGTNSHQAEALNPKEKRRASDTPRPMKNNAFNFLRCQHSYVKVGHPPRSRGLTSLCHVKAKYCLLYHKKAMWKIVN